MQKNKGKQLMSNLYHRGVQMLFMGIITGFLAGVVVTFYNILAFLGEETSVSFYDYVRLHPFLIPVLLLALAVVAFLTGVAIKFVPMISGSGIPPTEGVIKGTVRYNFLSVVCTKFAFSLAAIFLGLPVGSEGPSIQIGGCMGGISAALLTRTNMLRRYQVTGGACAGLAVAFNAPFTGMAFAFEETHKRFSPEIFICAFSSVITGIFTRNFIRSCLGLSTGAVLSTFTFNSQLAAIDYVYLGLAALVAAAVGIAFYYGVIPLKRKLEKKRSFLFETGKLILPFLLAGVFGLITEYAMGGGSYILESLGTNGGVREISFTSIFSSPIVVTLLVVLVIRFIMTCLDMACGIPGGAFIPMLTIGALCGGLMGTLFIQMGMDKSNFDLLVLVSMAAFFACVVRAPLTGIIMVVELTWSFTPLLPVLFGVAIGYMVGEVVHTKPIYDELLEQIVDRYGMEKNRVKISDQIKVATASKAADMAIKDVLWPAGTSVEKVVRAGKELTLEADLVLLGEDVISVTCLTGQPVEAKKELHRLCGDYVDSKENDSFWDRLKE